MKPELLVETKLDPNHALTFEGQQITFRQGRAKVPTPVALALCGSRPGYRLGEAAAEFSRDTWTPQVKHLLWDGTISGETGYGYFAEKMITELERLGVTVCTTPRQHRAELVNPIATEVLKRKPRYDVWGLRHAQVDEFDQLATARRVRYTMWESTGLPPGMADSINRCNDLVAVPCRPLVDIFRQNGVTVPIEVVGHGVDSATYSYRPPVERKEFVFGAPGYASKRKGMDVVLAAFQEEFPTEAEVRLVFKTKPGTLELKAPDPRISIVTERLSHQGLADLLGSFDVGVFASRGEGFGLYGIQTMAVGRTIICTDWLGMSEYANPKYNFPLQYELQEPQGKIFIDQWPRAFGLRYFGKWAEPSRAHLRQLMRYCYEHREQIWAMGKAASEWMARDWSWSVPARQLVDAITRHTR